MGPRGGGGGRGRGGGGAVGAVGAGARGRAARRGRRPAPVPRPDGPARPDASPPSRRPAGVATPPDGRSAGCPSGGGAWSRQPRSCPAPAAPALEPWGRTDRPDGGAKRSGGPRRCPGPGGAGGGGVSPRGRIPFGLNLRPGGGSPARGRRASLQTLPDDSITATRRGAPTAAQPGGPARPATGPAGPPSHRPRRPAQPPAPPARPATGPAAPSRRGPAAQARGGRGCLSRPLPSLPGLERRVGPGPDGRGGAARSHWLPLPGAAGAAVGGDSPAHLHRGAPPAPPGGTTASVKHPLPPRGERPVSAPGGVTGLSPLGAAGASGAAISRRYPGAELMGLTRCRRDGAGSPGATGNGGRTPALGAPLRPARRGGRGGGGAGVGALPQPPRLPRPSAGGGAQPRAAPLRPQNPPPLCRGPRFFGAGPRCRAPLPAPGPPPPAPPARPARNERSCGPDGAAGPGAGSPGPAPAQRGSATPSNDRGMAMNPPAQTRASPCHRGARPGSGLALLGVGGRGTPEQAQGTGSVSPAPCTKAGSPNTGPQLSAKSPAPSRALARHQARHGTARHGMARHSTAWRGVAQHSML
ncbi:basic proline-rich protein-like [Phalacrocorax carbo]|uniref:basic proline-rich protein-like n=1 Tax=Phalacrocorax carbo TaxID=9209 RepID=UPI003119480B